MNLSWLLPSIHGIPVLMYHRVWPDTSDSLTITPSLLHDHWSYLRSHGYHPLSLQEYLTLVQGTGPFPEKAMLITFDDGYQNNLAYVYPMLKEFGWKATFFIIASSLHTFEEPIADGPGKKMTLEELGQLDPSIVQLGMHGFTHENFATTGLRGVKEAIVKSLKAFDDSGLDYNKVLAYPYGARPAKRDFPAFKAFMEDIGIEAAFRIGNRVSRVPAPDIYEINRIDIKGTDSVKALGIKMKKGKLKPF